MINRKYAYKTPKTLLEAYTLKKKEKNAHFIAGGSDYVPLLKYNLKSPDSLISLSGLNCLNLISEENGIYIGALVTLREIACNQIIRHKLPSLAEAARRVASPQIRVMGTIAGNILQDRRCFYFNQTSDWRRELPVCYKLGGEVCLQIKKANTCRAIYYSDLAPVLASLDAKAELFSETNREISVKELIKEHVDRNGGIESHDFIIKGFKIPLVTGDMFTKFYKFALRDSLNFAILNVSVNASIENGVASISIFVGCASPYLIELKETATFISDQIGNIKSVKGNAGEIALTELSRNSELIREAGITIKTKKSCFTNIVEIVCELIDWLEKRKAVTSNSHKL